jgi:simple sugar transport system permease protein
MVSGLMLEQPMTTVTQSAAAKIQEEAVQRAANYERILNFLLPIIAVLASFLLGSILLWILNVNPIEAYTALIKGAFGTQRLIITTLLKSIPLIFAGLAVTLAYRGGVFNIGVEGQLYMGALFAVWAGTVLVLPYPWHLLVALLLGVLGGMVWGAIPGYLKASRDMNEIIVTILMNYIAIFTVSFFVHGPLKEEGWNTQTATVAETAQLPIIWAGTRMHAGFYLALICVAAVYILLFHTTLGYRIRMVGANKHAARYVGIKTTMVMALTMALSGGLAGLAGASELLGVQYRLIDNFSPGWGFDAIAVALVGRLHPLGTLLAALFFGAMRNGANSMQTAVKIDVVVVYILQGLAILFLIGGASANNRIRRWLEAWKV